MKTPGSEKPTAVLGAQLNMGLSHSSMVAWLSDEWISSSKERTQDSYSETTEETYAN